MKKWIAIFLLVAMMLSLVACGIGEDPEAQGTESLPEATTEAAEETTAEIEAVEETTQEISDTAEETTEEIIEATTEEITEEITEETAETEALTETGALGAEPFWAEEDVEYPMSFYFSSGAGAWGTELYLNEDGTFTGYFHDSNMGENGEGYPNGTVYLCEFEGKFSSAERLDMYTYAVTLLELNLDRPEGEEWIEDEIKYISWTPYGLENCERFLIYLPNTPANLLAEDTLFWWPGRYYEDYTTLHGYGLMNTEDGSCFFAMTEDEAVG